MHANFALKTSLLFYRSKLFSKDYKIVTSSTLEKVDELVGCPIGDFLPIEIKIYDKRHDESSPEMKVSKPKMIKKEIISKEDEKY